MAFQTNLEIDPSLSSESLALSPSAIRRVARQVERLARKHPKAQMWIKRMGARPDSWAILFCDDRIMRGFQKRYRKLDRTTDVLSFPSFERSELRTVFSKLPSGQKSLGDVVISMPAVSRGARRGRRTESVELLEVLIHSFLHLLGFDHVVGPEVRPQDAREMRKFQRQIFLALRRELKL